MALAYIGAQRSLILRSQFTVTPTLPGVILPLILFRSPLLVLLPPVSLLLPVPLLLALLLLLSLRKILENFSKKKQFQIASFACTCAFDSQLEAKSMLT